MSKLNESKARREPRKVILFSGHMIDKPGRKPARFPPEMEPAVTREIAKILNSWDIGPEDLALCGGACGGDLIFAELCLKKDTLLEIRIPFNEPEFLRKSVNFAGDQWQSRFYKVKDNPNTKLLIMPDELGPLISYIKEHTPNIHKAIISVHCLNDLGIATANSLAGRAAAEAVVAALSGRARGTATAAVRQVGGGVHALTVAGRLSHRAAADPAGAGQTSGTRHTAATTVKRVGA